MIQRSSDSAGEALREEVRERFGVLPNFYCLDGHSPEITRNLWGFARFGYLDNPLPSLFKERLFVYLSRFCDVRYSIARHVGFLVGLGRPSGDRLCPPQTVDEVVRLIRQPLPRGAELNAVLALMEIGPRPLSSVPGSEERAEQSVFAAATHVFLQTPHAAECLEALENRFDAPTLEQLLVLLAFVRTAHYWTKVHPELELEPDVVQLLEGHERLADCVLNDSEASAGDTALILEELHSLRTERALRQEMSELFDADRRKTEFLAMLGHELRNPLGPIRNAADILRASPDDQQHRDRAIEIILRQVDHVGRLVDDLLDISRISRGRIELRRERLELASVVYHAVEAARPLCEAMGHQLTVTLPGEPIYLNADPTRLAQVVGNLLNNACKFTNNGGDIRLIVERRDDQALVRVQDNGIGIEADQLVRIFEMFTQVEPPFAGNRAGLGLGLALVRTLVEMHGGSVEASSEGVGCGSEFVVTLPIVQAAPSTRPAGSGASRTAVTPRRILVVDDNRDSADSLATLLRLAGHESHVAYDGIEALEAAQSLRPEVALLDIGLPKLSGLEVASRIRREPWGKSMLLIAITGWGQDEDRARSKDAGFDEHMVKPVDQGALAKLLSEGSGHRGSNEGTGVDPLVETPAGS